MAAPVQPVARPVRSHSWFMLVISAVLFIVAAFAFSGDGLSGISPWTWAAAAAAAYVLAWVVP